MNVCEPNQCSFSWTLEIYFFLIMAKIQSQSRLDEQNLIERKGKRKIKNSKSYMF
jgi:hypothetical protein